MEFSSRTCSHCKTYLQQEGSAFELVRKTTGSLESPPGLPVTVYVCPQCGLIELYNLKVLTRY